MKSEKVYTINRILIYVIFGLGVLLVASIVANIFMFYKSQSRVFDCNLGQNIEIEFSEQDTTLLANIVYPSNIVSGTKYKQKITLKVGDISGSYYVRAKAIYADYNIVGESLNVEISPNSSWHKGNSEYYYLDALVSDYQSIDFIDSLTLPVVPSSVRNNTIVSIYFQFIPSTLDPETVWGENIPTI